MQSWKLVEAEPEPEQESEVQETQDQFNGERKQFRGGRGRDGRGRGRGSGRGRGQHSPNVPYRSKADRSYFAFLAVQQIDAIFNPDSLAIDTFIRSYMDVEGYVPIGLVINYQNVAAFGCSYYDVVNKLKEVAHKCKYYEVDPINETIRLKEGWEKYLMPNPWNPTGPFGLPRYIKNANTSTGYNQPSEEATEESLPAETQA